jgi:hypothetical protein
MNSGRDVRVAVTVKYAPPGSVIIWEQSVISPLGSVGSVPCYYRPTPVLFCGVDLKHGTATANGAGVATFSVTFIPGQVYDAAEAQSAGEVDGLVIWDINVWDNSSQTPAVAAVPLEAAASAPPPADWSRS